MGVPVVRTTFAHAARQPMIGSWKQAVHTRTLDTEKSRVDD